MSTDLLSALRASGVELWAQDGQLRYRAPAGVMTDVLMGQLRARKSELLTELAEKPPAVEPTELHACGGGVYHQTARGGTWLCSFCSPRVAVPVTVFVVPGGHFPPVPPDIDELTENATEFFAERGALAEYDGGLSRNDAERQASERIFEYKLAGWEQWGVLLMQPGDTLDDANAWCRERFGPEKFISARPYRPGNT